MAQQQKRTARRVLIASGNPLFGRGLEKILHQRNSANPPEIRMVTSMAETHHQMEEWQPELVIVDYDDHNIDRSIFLSYFVATDMPMQAMLVSLQASGAVVVYDRKTLTPAQAEIWLSLSPVEQNPVSTPSQTERSTGSMRHFVIAGILVVISTVLVFLFFTNAGLLPVEAAQQAVTVDRMFTVHFALIAFLFSLIAVFIGYSLVVFRRKPGETGEGKYFKGNSRLEIIWTLVPLATVITLSYIGSQNLAEVKHEDLGAMIVNVTAFQWNWEFQYPDYNITTNTLVLPVNKQVLFKLTSRDVIHSFWVPEFRIKQDVLPGANLVKELRINPTLIGNYTVRCAEMCGGAHAAMERPVNVVSQGDFDAWAASESAANVQDPAALGQKLAESQCKACHSFDGKAGIAPTLKGLADSKVDLIDGSSVTAEDAYLKESILLPAAKVVKGYQNIMPSTYKDSLSEQQMANLIAFIRSLK